MCNSEKMQNPLRRYIRALHCPNRWRIIRFIGEGEKSTKEIYAFLQEHNEGISRSGVYFHLSELKNADIIEVAEFREEGGGAPEKVWKLKRKKIEIDLLEVGKEEAP